VDRTRTESNKRSLRFSLLDGICASGMAGFIQDYLAPFLLLLGGTVRDIGALSALPNLFSSLVQLKSPDLTATLRSRKRIIIIFVALQTLMIVPMVVLALGGAARPSFFIVIVIFFTSFGAFANPPWSSLMSDLVPENERGSFFGWRNKVLGFITVAVTFIAGFILHESQRTNVYRGFAVIFSCAFILRAGSWYFLTRMGEPSLAHAKEHSFTIRAFLSRVKESNFAQFVIFVSSMTFAVNIAAPFFVVLMLRELHFSYLLYSAITVTATLTMYCTIQRWGHLADRIGNLRVLAFVSPIIAVLPVLWVINRHPAYLFFVQVVGGFVWAGFNLCASNFIYDAVTPEKRTRCISYFNVLNGIALCIGALLGGTLVQKLPPLFGHRILSLLLISSAIRLIIAFSMPRRLKEVRPVKHIRSADLFFSVIGVKALIGIDRKAVRF